MRRLTEPDRDDHGVATIVLICAMAVIFIGAAFAIDVGRYVVEARSAQNSADATVLALATDCAGPLNGPIPDYDYSDYRKTGQTINTPACGSYEAIITVTMPVSDGLFLNRNAGSVTRSATARWGTLSQATVVPLIISDCEFSQALLDGTTDITFYLDDTKPQSGCSSLPGGFSQLLATGCGVTVTADGTAAGDPGGDLNKQVDCITNPTAPKLPHDILIALYDADACAAADCKGHGPYPVLGFAALHITGYSFNGNDYDGTLDKKCPDETRGKYCIRGDFIRFTTSQGTPGPSTDYGTTQVYLSS
jgi:Flp pilus assembly protein TadG